MTGLEKIVDKIEYAIRREVAPIPTLTELLKLTASWRRYRSALEEIASGWSGYMETRPTEDQEIARAALQYPSDVNTDDNGLRLDGN